MPIDLDQLLSAWPISQFQMLRLIGAGSNNQSRLVTTPDADYILRLYENTDDAEAVQYEHTLLCALQATTLSFAVPNPVVAASGETFVATDDDGQTVLAALFPVIPGRRPDINDAADVEACGAALGELDRALAGVELDPELPEPPAFGDILQSLALIRNPVASAKRYPLDFMSHRGLALIFQKLLGALPQFDERFPRQLIHGDFFTSNVLVADGLVTGVLDFEYSGPGVRAMDLAIGLGAFAPAALSGDADALHIAERFAAGYRRWILPADFEITAIPTLLLLRETTSLVHWLARHQQGLTSDDDIAERADRVLHLDADLSAHGDKLVKRVASVMT